MYTATFLKDNDCSDNNCVVKQSVYKVNPPMKDDNGTEFNFVVVSAANVMYSGPETYIFGSDEKGEVLDWGELEGSYRGGLSHEEALNNAGYVLL